MAQKDINRIAKDINRFKNYMKILNEGHQKGDISDEEYNQILEELKLVE